MQMVLDKYPDLKEIEGEQAYILTNGQNIVGVTLAATQATNKLHLQNLILLVRHVKPHLTPWLPF